MNAMLESLWSDDLVETCTIAGRRWPQLLEYADAARQIPADHPHTRRLTHAILMALDRDIDPELVYRTPTTADADESLMALDLCLRRLRGDC